MFMRGFLGITLASASVLASVVNSNEADVNLDARHTDSNDWKSGYDHKHHEHHDAHGYHDKFDIFAGPEGDGLGGNLKTFTINITESRTSLTNGSDRFHYEINDQVYGTPIIIDESDEVEFIIDNYSFTETTIHLHGLLQQLSPWADGVPGVTQAVIPQNKRYIYRTRIMDQHGLYWVSVTYYDKDSSDNLVGSLTSS